MRSSFGEKQKKVVDVNRRKFGEKDTIIKDATENKTSSNQQEKVKSNKVNYKSDTTKEKMLKAKKSKGVKVGDFTYKVNSKGKAVRKYSDKKNIKQGPTVDYHGRSEEPFNVNDQHARKQNTTSNTSNASAEKEFTNKNKSKASAKKGTFKEGFDKMKNNFKAKSSAKSASKAANKVTSAERRAKAMKSLGKGVKTAGKAAAKLAVPLMAADVAVELGKTALENNKIENLEKQQRIEEARMRRGY